MLIILNLRINNFKLNYLITRFFFCLFRINILILI